MKSLDLRRMWNKGYGRRFLNKIDKRAMECGTQHIELMSVNDGSHMHFNL